MVEERERQFAALKTAGADSVGLHRARLGAIGCHLMVEKPERQLAALKTAGADSVSFHLAPDAHRPSFESEQ